MSVDAVTFIAQCVNFAVLLWLLQRFLYRPLLGVMDTRERRLQEREAEAARLQEAAKQTQARLDQEVASMHDEAERIRTAATSDAQLRRSEMMARLRDDVTETEKHWRAAMRKDQKRFVQRTNQAASSLLVGMVRRALEDVADETLERRIVARFLRMLEELSSTQKEELRHALSTSERVLVYTTFDLPADERRQMSEELERWAERRLQVDFAQSPDLVCGIALRANGFKIASTMDAYLRGFESDLEGALPHP